MARKTVNIDMVKAMGNLTLRTNEMNPAYRQGIAELLSTILMDTGNYRGFRYLTADEIPAGHKPGIHPSDNYDERFADTDPTRVQYF